MPTGMFALTIMARNWEDVFMHATTMMLAKINVQTSSKLANSTALARYKSSVHRTVRCLSFFISDHFSRKIVLVAVHVMTILVQRQQQPQMSQLLPHQLRPHHLLLQHQLRPHRLLLMQSQFSVQDMIISQWLFIGTVSSSLRIRK